MRIAVIHSFYQSGSPSGENQVVLAQVAALEKAGHTVALISQSSDDFDTEKASYRAGRAWRVATGYGASPEREISAFQPDIVHSHNLFPNWGFRWIEKIQAPVVHSVHNFRPLCAAGTLYRDGAPCTLCPTRTSLYSVANSCYRGVAVATIPLAIATAKPFSRQYVPRHVDQIVFLSDHQRTTYEEFDGAIGHAVVVPNFVPEVKSYDRGGSSPTGWCYIGRISEEKGVFDLVGSWPQGVPLTFYGDGPGVAQLSAILTDDMVYRGPIPNEQVNEILLSHKGLVFPSKVAEISPLTYMESLRAGRPVLAFGANAAARDIRSNSGRGGEVFDDWEDLTRAVHALDNNVSAPREAREVYEEKFSSAAWLSAMEAVYASVVQTGTERS